MKTAIIVAFACCFALALAEVGQNCKGGDDCDEGECCVRVSLFTRGRCQKLRQKGESCFQRESWNKVDDRYRVRCPCVEGLICKVAEGQEEEVFKDSFCVEPDSTIF